MCYSHGILCSRAIGTFLPWLVFRCDDIYVTSGVSLAGRERRDRLEGDIFELLLSFSDFSHFKEMMLDYRRFKDGEVPDLSGVITQVRLPG